MPPARDSLAMPLLYLLGINCAAGIAVAMLAVGGLLALNPLLRELIFSDHSPAIPLALLGGGFIVTFSSVAMGTAIMLIGRRDDGASGGRRREARGDETGGLRSVRVKSR